jgi:hypothetical protein
MGTKDPRVDDYIAAAAPFARPILKHLRRLIHRTCPDVEETMKWSFPHFQYRGILCSMAAFKAHSAFGFWKGALLNGNAGGLEKTNRTAMGHLGRITSKRDLPPDAVMTALISEAMQLNEMDVKPPRHARRPGLKPKIPGYFASALRNDKKALTTFERFSDSHKREYLDWVTEAKGEETRARRLAAAIEWMAEGKPRHWKYMKK